MNCGTNEDYYIKCSSFHTRRHILPKTATGNDIELKEAGCSSDVKVVGKKCEEEGKQKEPRLFWAMVKAFGMKALVAALFKLVFDIMQFLSPLIMK